MDEKIELCGYTAQAGLNQPVGAGGWKEKDVPWIRVPLHGQGYLRSTPYLGLTQLRSNRFTRVISSITAKELSVCNLFI